MTEMMKPISVCLDRLLVHGRLVVQRLNQFVEHVPAERECDADRRRGGRTAVGLALRPHFAHRRPWTDLQTLGELFHRSVQIFDNEP